MTVYVVYESQGGHEVLVSEIFDSELKAAEFISSQDNPRLYFYETQQVK